eukprot:SAG31_NODE_7914_length_1566_cov_2.299932_2_plen_72_part_00
MKVDVFQADLLLQQQLLSQCLEKVGVVREAEIKASAVIVHPFAHLLCDSVWQSASQQAHLGLLGVTWDELG